VTGYLVSCGDEGWAEAGSPASHTFTGLVNGRTYTFRARAVSAAGEGEIASLTAKLNFGGLGEDDDVELADEGEELPPDDEPGVPAEDDEPGVPAEDDEEGVPDGGTAGGGTSVSAVSERDAAAAANEAALPVDSLIPDDDGNLRYSVIDATIAAMETWPEQSIEEVAPLPLARAGVSAAGATVELRFNVKGSKLFADRAADVKVMKVKRGGRGDAFVYAGSRPEFTDGRFTILKGGLVYGGVIEREEEYTLALFVKDGGEFDLDPAPARVLDPAVLVRDMARGASGEAESNKGENSGGTGGCGMFPAAVVMAIIAVSSIAKRRRSS
jgi:hypothetical protein